MRFRHAYHWLALGWLSGDHTDGERVLYTIGLMLDGAIERIRQGLFARFPYYGPEDALAQIGRDRLITRGLGEPAAAYADRLVRWLDDHRTRGNPWTLSEQLRAYFQADCLIRTVDRRGNWFSIAADGTRSSSIDQANWLWDATAASQWSRFWVIIYPNSDGLPWTEGTWATSRTTLSATANEIATVKSIIRRWKPAGTKCEWIIVCLDDTKLAPTMSPGDADFPNSDWGEWTIADGAQLTYARYTNARYLVGPR